MGAPSFNLEVARQQAGLSMSELWFACLALGSTAMPSELQAYLLGLTQPNRHEHDVVALALNERFADMDLNHPIPYRR